MFGRRRRPTRPTGQATPTRRARPARSNTMARPARPARPTRGPARPARPTRGPTRVSSPATPTRGLGRKLGILQSRRRISRARPTGLARMTRGLTRRSR